MSAIETLQFWRNEDHEDNIVLTRHEVCVLLDEVSKLRAALEEILSLQPLKTQHEHYIAMLKALDIARKALAGQKD